MGTESSKEMVSPPKVTSECWYCGRRISSPRFFITENVLSYGVRSGTITTPIHSGCYVKALDEGLGHYFIKGLEVK